MLVMYAIPVSYTHLQAGYRGTSYESVFLLSASEAGLRKVNEMYVPEQLDVYKRQEY